MNANNNMINLNTELWYSYQSKIKIKKQFKENDYFTLTRNVIMTEVRIYTYL